MKIKHTLYVATFFVNRTKRVDQRSINSHVGKKNAKWVGAVRWYGAVGCGVVWSDVGWSDVGWRSVVWCRWRGMVMLCGVDWGGTLWCGMVVRYGGWAGWIGTTYPSQKLSS